MNTNAIKELITIDEQLNPLLAEKEKININVKAINAKILILEEGRAKAILALHNNVYSEDYPVTYQYKENTYIFDWYDGGPKFNLVKKTIAFSE